MLVSKSKNFIYIHVDRTGGTSIHKALKKYTLFERSSTLHKLLIRNVGEIPSILLLKDQTALSLRGKLLASIWEKSFKFAMVRNPWDWMVSHYSYVKQYPSSSIYPIAKDMSFKEFLEWCLIENYRGIDPLGLKRGLSAWFTNENGESIVNYVGRFESFSSEFEYICSKIGVETSLQHLNKSSYSTYRDYYDESSRELIQEFFQLDLTMFNYQF